MSNLIECGHAEKVPTEEIEMKSGISPTMVYTILKKPDKIRVAFEI